MSKHGEFEETSYMDQLEGFNVDGKDHVRSLLKSLYDLKQSPRQWYKRFATFMIEHGLSKIKFHNCLYEKQL